MIHVSRAGDRPGGWADKGRRVATPPGAAAESIARSASVDVSVQSALVLCLLALSTTLPLALLRPGGAAVAVSAASVLSLTLFHTLTVAGLAAQLLVLFRFG